MRAVPRIALTGGVASGKSTVAQPVRRAGREAHRHRPDRARGRRARLARARPDRRAFRPRRCCTPDGSLDRARLREHRVRRSGGARRARGHHASGHPRRVAGSAAAQAGGPYQIIAVPLLVETGDAARLRPRAGGGLRPAAAARATDGARWHRPRAGAQRMLARAGIARRSASRSPTTCIDNDGDIAALARAGGSAASPLSGRRPRSLIRMTPTAARRPAYAGGRVHAQYRDDPGIRRQHEQLRSRAAAAAPLIFEQPLNERMRTFLRLDLPLQPGAVPQREGQPVGQPRRRGQPASTSWPSPPAATCAPRC